MNKSLSLTALLFLAGPTLLTYGAQDPHERDRELTRLREIRERDRERDRELTRLREIRERDRERDRGKYIGRNLARTAGTFLEGVLGGARQRARVRNETGERHPGKDLGLGLADSVQQLFQVISRDAEPREGDLGRDLNHLRAISESPELTKKPSAEIRRFLNQILVLNHRFSRVGHDELVRNPELANLANLNALKYLLEHVFVTGLNVAKALKVAHERENDEAFELARVNTRSDEAITDLERALKESLDFSRDLALIRANRRSLGQQMSQ